MKLVFYTDDEDIVSLVEDNSSFKDVQFIENINDVEGLLDEGISFLVILDFDSNKKQCEKLLKNIYEFENVQSVIVSSEMKIKHFKKHQKSKYGADGYLRKPLNQIDLIQVYDDFCFNIEPSNSEDDSENVTDVEFSTSSSEEEVAKESSAKLDETFDIHEDEPSELDKNNEFSSSEIEFDLDSSTEQDIGETMSNDETNDKDSSLNTDSQLDLETDSNLDIDTSIDIESSFDEESLNLDEEVNVSTDTSIDKKSDLDLGEESDVGIDLDLGGESDVGVDLDLGGEADAGIDLNLGGEADAGIDLDLGGEADAGIDLNLGGEADSGIDLDLGGEVDAGIDLDLGGEVDAGIDLDLGGEVDAGIDLDLGEESDAGLDLDLGEEADAGIDLNLGEAVDGETKEESSSVLEFDGVEMSDIGEKDISEVKEIDVEVDELQAALDISTDEGEEFESIEMSDIANKDISEVKEIEVEVDELKEVLETTSSDAVTQDAEMLAPTIMTEDETGDMDISILDDEDDSLDDDVNLSEDNITDDLFEENHPVEQISEESIEQVIIGQERVLPAQINEDELIRLQATIRHLRDERESLLSKNEKLESEQQRLSQQSLGHVAEVDDLKIELSIQKKRFNKEVEFLKEKLEISEEKKSIYEEKLKRSQKEIGLLGQKVRVDLNKIKERETELESQLELQTMDYESQITTRDKKLLELKRKIDSLEFNMENASIKEQQSRKNQVKVEERLRAVMKTLRGSLEMMEDDLDDKDSIIKKIGRIG